MYEAFYELKHKPFSLLPDPEFLFLSEKHAIALSLLEYSLSGQAGFCVITGEIGSGKTTLLRAFLTRIGREFTVGLISNTHSSLRDVAYWVLTAFGQKPLGTNPAETYQELMAFLISEYGEGRQCILIVDEAQNLSIEALEELRLLSNINSGKDLLLQMVLVGQPELLHKLRSPELVQFAQRVAVSHHLAPLSYSETRRYILHRLAVAGASKPVFTEMAMGAVQYFSGGVPRLINSICDLSLVYGFADGKSPVDEAMVLRVVADRQNSGIAPFARSESPDDPSTLAEIGGLAEANREQESREQELREQELREQELREQELREQELREQELREQDSREQDSGEQESAERLDANFASIPSGAPEPAPAAHAAATRGPTTHATAIRASTTHAATTHAASAQAAATQAAATQAAAVQSAARSKESHPAPVAEPASSPAPVQPVKIRMGAPSPRFPQEEETPDDFYFADTVGDDVSALSSNSLHQGDTVPLFEYPQTQGAKASLSAAAASERPGTSWPAADAMDSKSWPSITGRQPRPAGRTGFGNREPELAEQRRSSWWRRSFLRS